MPQLCCSARPSPSTAGCVQPASTTQARQAHPVLMPTASWLLHPAMLDLGPDHKTASGSCSAGCSKPAGIVGLSCPALQSFLI